MIFAVQHSRFTEIETPHEVVSSTYDKFSDVLVRVNDIYIAQFEQEMKDKGIAYEI